MTPEISAPEIGSTGLQHYSGYVTEEFLPELRGAVGMRRFREMYENSAILGAAFQAIEKLFRQFHYEWEPADLGNKQAHEIAEFFTRSLDDLDIPFADVIESNQSTFTFGWQIKERRLKRRVGLVLDAQGAIDASRSSKYADGLVSWARFAERAQESSAGYNPWEISDDGSKIISWTQIDMKGQRRRIPMEKCLHFRTTRVKNNPEGRSLLRNAWFSWHFFKRISESEAIGISRDLTGIAVADVPADWFATDAPEWQKALLASIRQTIVTVSRGENEGLVWPLAYDNQQRTSDIRLLNSGGKRQFDTGAIIERYERRMAMVFLADLLLMGHESTGSFALSDNKKNLLEVAIEGHAANLLGEYQRDAPLIMRMNGWPLELTPKLKAKTRTTLELGPLGDFVSKITAAGFRWNDDKEIDQFLRESAGLPRRSKSEGTEKPAAGTPDAEDAPDDPTDPSAPSDRVVRIDA